MHLGSHFDSETAESLYHWTLPVWTSDGLLRRMLASLPPDDLGVRASGTVTETEVPRCSIGVPLSVRIIARCLLIYVSRFTSLIDALRALARAIVSSCTGRIRQRDHAVFERTALAFVKFCSTPSLYRLITGTLDEALLDCVIPGTEASVALEAQPPDQTTLSIKIAPRENDKLLAFPNHICENK